MLIYIVTVGDYSEYHIQKVFTDETKANAYVKLLNRTKYANYANLETWETDENPSFVVYHVSLSLPRKINARGLDRGEDLTSEPVITHNKHLTQVVEEIPPVVVSKHRMRPNTFIGAAYGKTYEAAEKSLYDAIAKAKAEDLEL